MSEHWNVQVNIQRVIHAEEKPVPSADRRAEQRGLAGIFNTPPRSITKVLDLSVTADSEAEAYDKVRRVLDANEPVREGLVLKRKQ